MGHEIFKQYLGYDRCGRRSSDIRLLLLGVLCYIGRAWTFKDIYEATVISIDTKSRVFVKVFGILGVILFFHPVLTSSFCDHILLSPDLDSFWQDYPFYLFINCK